MQLIQNNQLTDELMAICQKQKAVRNGRRTISCPRPATHRVFWEEGPQDLCRYCVTTAKREGVRVVRLTELPKIRREANP